MIPAHLGQQRMLNSILESKTGKKRIKYSTPYRPHLAQTIPQGVHPQHMRFTNHLLQLLLCH